MPGSKNSLKSCNDCSGADVAHTVAYIDAAINTIFKVSQLQPRVPLSFFYWVLLFSVQIGIARKQTIIDEKMSLLSQMLWKEAVSRGITLWEFRLFNLERNIFFAKLSSGKSIIYEGIPLPLQTKTHVHWIDNKAVLKKKFQQLGLPVPKGEAVFKSTTALKTFRNLSVPVVVKPHIGSASRHTTLHITDQSELLHAFSVAKQVSPIVIIEEELTGPVYRATVVGGKLVATLRRDPPYVIGDGKRMVKELVNEANKHPARGGPYFSKIVIDDSAINELKWYGYTPDDILPEGTRVTLHQKVNWSKGGTTTDVTDDVHADNVELFERVAKVLTAPIVGIDFIIEDIARSWKDTRRCGIIECNSMPFFDNHHLPFEGKPRNVAGAIWDMVENTK